VAESSFRGVTSHDPSFIPRSQLLSSDEVARALRRMAHEVIEHNADVDELGIIGLQNWRWFSVRFPDTPFVRASWT
jgi:hypothetical protein